MSEQKPKGYAVRGKCRDKRDVYVYWWSAIGDVQWTADRSAVPNDAALLFATLGEAISALLKSSHLRDVRILAVAEDDTETLLPTYEEALAIVDLARRLVRSSDLKVTTRERARIDCDEEPYAALLSRFEAERVREITIPGLVCVECDRPIYRGSQYAGRTGDAAHKACRNWPAGTTFRTAGEGNRQS
jgi:hypothetical protein